MEKTGAEVMSAHRPTRPIPARHLEVARLWADGWKVEAISRRLGLTSNTVRHYVEQVRDALPPVDEKMLSRRRIRLFIEWHDSHTA